MGIRGLTTFVQNRSHMCMERFELHDSALVIDGNSIACQLYNRRTRSNDCFGGDYDNYRQIVFNFYDLLKQCNITPYVVFDGGYERKKIATVMTRMKSRIGTARNLDVNNSSASVFPLFLRETFVGITLKLGIKVVRCDFESDTEIANIARALDCPVLSYDSDFFIFDVLYIPFSTLELNVRNGKSNSCKYKCIPCELYKVEKFLKSYNLDKSNLPLLAVLLGNDYVKRSMFSMFYKNLKVQKCHGNEEQKRIKSLIVWLQNETPHTAISKVLGRFKSHKRKYIARSIQRAMEGYSCYNSIYLKYLEIEPVSKGQVIQFDIESLIEKLQEEPDTGDESSTSCESSAEDIGSEAEEEQESSVESRTVDTQREDSGSIDKSYNPILPYFLERFRRCLYPACFMDFLVQNRYYCVPQVENYCDEQSHSVSLELISAINKILSNSNDSLDCIVRTGLTNVGILKVPVYPQHLPSLLEIESHSELHRKDMLLSILKLQKSVDVLGLVPPSWHIFILSIQYFIENVSVSWPIIYALVMSKIIIGHVDSKMGYIRTSKALSKVSKDIPSNVSHPSDLVLAENSYHQNFLDHVSLIEYVSILKSFTIYFSTSEKILRNPKLFDITLVHSISQFQSCLLHISYLNSLLNCPFENFLASESLNCTFVYNFAWNLTKRANLDDYVEGLFGDAKSLFSFFRIFMDGLKTFSMGKVQHCSKRKRKRKHKKTESVLDETEVIIDSNNEDALYDPNNRFSILAN